MKNITWIFFDVGGVLIDDQWSEDLRVDNVTKVLQEFKKDITKEQVQRMIPKASEMLGPMNHNMFSLFLDSVEQVQEAKKMMYPLWEGSNYVQKAELRIDALDVVAALSEKYKLGFMANQKAEMRDKLEELGVLKYFDHDLMSKHYEMRKPNPEFFKNVLADAHVNAENAVIIDDNIERALIPAKQLGMTTVWFDRGWRRKYPQDFIDDRIESLSELKNIFL